MNPIFLLTKNNLQMNQRCIESCLRQDSETKVYVYDNESQDETKPWVNSCPDITNLSMGFDLGVSAGWNYGLETLFSEGVEHVLLINSDVVLPPWFYSTLLSYPGPFITGV